MAHVTCSISTKGRYDTSLPLAIQSVITQTQPPNQLIIYDDNDQARDVRGDPVYDSLFRIMQLKNIHWEWIWSGKKGQHHNHQMANERAPEWVWRVDDDCVAEPTVLENLLKYANPGVGGVAGSCLTPHWDQTERQVSGLIDNIDSECHIQWGHISSAKQVDHLHCSFLYRAQIHDYNLALSKVAHREETLFTWGLKQRGLQLWVIPQAVTWHLKLDAGGIRSDNQAELYAHDDHIFRNFMQHKDKTIVVLDNGRGDHVMFKRVLDKIKNPLVFSCYPDIIPGQSIQEAKNLFGDIDGWNIYKKMHMWNWRQSVQKAYEKLYGVAS